MKINKFILVLNVILLVLVVSSLAENTISSWYSCDVDFDCEELYSIMPELIINENSNIKCDLITKTCYESEISVSLGTSGTPVAATISTNATTNITTNTTTPQTSALNSQLTELKKNVATLTTRINSLEGSDSIFEQQLTGLNSEMQSLSGSLQSLEQVQGELNAVAVGLAGLQQNLKNTTSEVAVIEANLAKKTARNKVIGIISIILLMLLVFGFLAYYMIGKKNPFGKVDEKIVAFITGYIKQGWKYPHIKEKLMSSGWSEQEIQWAYKETIKKNYDKYKQGSFTQQDSSKKKVDSSKPAEVGTDKKKMITIAVVSMLLIIGVLFVLNGTTGQAIFFQKFITDGVVSYSVDCTAPHTLNPDKDGCCLDFDNSGKCDYIEAKEENTVKVSSGSACSDSFQCQQGEFCIDGSCQTLASQYKGFGDCSKQCNTYAVKISTSDGEVYPVKPGQGSYTATGALEWKILEGPTHCKGEPAFVPIKVIRKDVGEIINQELFALRQGETSKIITHPTVPLSFTLKVDKIFEHCPE